MTIKYPYKRVSSLYSRETPSGPKPVYAPWSCLSSTRAPNPHATAFPQPPKGLVLLVFIPIDLAPILSDHSVPFVANATLASRNADFSFSNAKLTLAAAAAAAS